jgi:hypothetical protein
MKPSEIVSVLTRRHAAFLLRRITSNERPNFGVLNDQDVDCSNHRSVHGIQRQRGNVQN